MKPSYVQLEQTLRTIAATPVWGESIDDEVLKTEYAESGEYDLETDEFNPSADTECNHLRDVVELARSIVFNPDQLYMF